MKNKARSGWLSVFDYFFILRPMLFYPGWSTFLAGYLIHTKSRLFYLTHISSRIWLLLFAFAILMGGAFILNQLRDAESDRVNKKLFMISDGIVAKKVALTESVVLVISALIIGFIIKLEVGIIFLLFFIVTGILYNYKPMSLKDRPWGSLIANSAMGWLAFAGGWCAQHELSGILLMDALPYLFFNTALYIFTMLPDIEGDKKMNKRTLAVLHGPENMIRAAFLLYIFGFILTVILVDYLAMFFYVCSFPFFVVSVIGLKIDVAMQTTKYAILFCAVAICLRWPFYFPLMLLGFVITKVYYKARFNFNYPRFAA